MSERHRDLSSGAATRIILDWLACVEAAGAVEDMGEPHVVVVFDPESKRMHAIGPFPDGAAAAVSAAGEADRLNACGPDGLPFAAWPVRLWPHPTI